MFEGSKEPGDKHSTRLPQAQIKKELRFTSSIHLHLAQVEIEFTQCEPPVSTSATFTHSKEPKVGVEVRCTKFGF